MYIILFETLSLILLLADRIYRMTASKEYQRAKEAQIVALQQQLELERRNNDTEIAELLKNRYENLKLIVADREELAGELLQELNAIALRNHQQDIEHKVLWQQLAPKQLVDLSKLRLKTNNNV